MRKDSAYKQELMLKVKDKESIVREIFDVIKIK